MARKFKRVERVYDKYSETHGERYCIDFGENDKAYFESGVTYTKKEQSVLNGMDPEIKKRIHQLKKIFGGHISC